MRFTLTPRSPKAVAIRSWVRGRPGGLPEILVAIAWASKEPIQIGRYLSASFSFRITRCCAVGMWIRMLSTETSMRFFILGPILPPRLCHPSLVSVTPHPARLPTRRRLATPPSPRAGGGSVAPGESKRGEGEARAAGSDRPPQPHIQGIFRAGADEHLGRPGDQRGLRVHVHA